MGLIVVNQTDAKQSIVLKSTPEGVTGGYYDQNGNWNEFGGSTPETPVIKVTIGYGTSGTSIVANSKRAISDPIPWSDPDNIQAYAPDNCSYTVKLCTGDDTVSNLGFTVAPSALIGTTGSGFVTWRNYCSGSIVRVKDNIIVKAEVAESNGFIRFVFELGDGTADFTSEVDGYIVVDGILYHLMSE